jgi:hypothetical protein
VPRTYSPKPVTKSPPRAVSKTGARKKSPSSVARRIPNPNVPPSRRPQRHPWPRHRLSRRSVRGPHHPTGSLHGQNPTKARMALGSEARVAARALPSNFRCSTGSPVPRKTCWEARSSTIGCRSTTVAFPTATGRSTAKPSARTISPHGVSVLLLGLGSASVFADYGFSPGTPVWSSRCGPNRRTPCSSACSTIPPREP